MALPMAQAPPPDTGPPMDPGVVAQQQGPMPPAGGPPGMAPVVEGSPAMDLALLERVLASLVAKVPELSQPAQALLNGLRNGVPGGGQPGLSAAMGPTGPAGVGVPDGGPMPGGSIADAVKVEMLLAKLAQKLPQMAQEIDAFVAKMREVVSSKPQPQKPGQIPLAPSDRMTARVPTAV